MIQKKRVEAEGGCLPILRSTGVQQWAARLAPGLASWPVQCQHKKCALQARHTVYIYIGGAQSTNLTDCYDLETSQLSWLPIYILI